MKSSFIDVDDLRIGLYVHIDLGWMSHPFPLSSFKLQSQEQIATIRSLGIERIRYSPEKSDPEPVQGVPPESLGKESSATEEGNAERQRHLALLSGQNAGLKACERQYSQAAKEYKKMLAAAKTHAGQSQAQAAALVGDVLGQLSGFEESSIRLLSEQIGDRASLHAINVLVLSLLLGKACGLDDANLQELGCGALLHDIGKLELPSRLHWNDEQFSTAEKRLYQEHVAHGIVLGREMGLSDASLLCIAQHHEAVNGSGYPMRLQGERISRLAKIVALTNQYDKLCNPGSLGASLTPHEALSTIFTQMKGCFDATTMSVFIRMMGVYPPGSVVQLTNDRFAMVASVNSSRPLKPRLIIHVPLIPKEEALIVDLETRVDLGIRRSVNPKHLPRHVLDYLSPRKHICYFFERASNLSGNEGAP